MEYTTKGTCSRKILFEITEDNKLHNVQFVGGCNGNSQGVAALVKGMTAEEAVMELDRFLDLAFRLRLPSATIIHGKGTGVLRQAVHSRLKGARQVKSFRLGAYGEGESGVTVVEFK